MFSSAGRLLMAMLITTLFRPAFAADANHDEPAPPGIHPIVKRDAQGAAVKLCQELLNQHGKPAPALNVDGMFGSSTEIALKAFQSKHDLTADGIAGRATWESLTGIEVQPQVSTTPQALVSLRRLLDRAGEDKAVITSGRRTAVEQARIMYENLKKHGVESQRTLYGPVGDQVIDVYVANEDQPRDVVIARMKDKIKDLGPGKVSKHCSDDRDVIDVAPSSIDDHDKFLKALAWAKERGFVLHFIPPPADPAFHIEFEK